jgi:hypothetical protein
VAGGHLVGGHLVGGHLVGGHLVGGHLVGGHLVGELVGYSRVGELVFRLGLRLGYRSVPIFGV